MQRGLITKMRIVQITSVYKIGSVGKIVDDIHTSIIQNGYESYVLYGIGKKYTSPNLIKTTTKIERDISHLYYLLTGINFSLCFFGTRKIIKSIKRINPDVVHIHGINDYYMNIHILLRWLNKHNYRVVLTQHNEQYYTGSCGYSLSCEKWKENGCDSRCHFFNSHISGYPHLDKSKYMFNKMKNTLSRFNKNNLFVISCTPWLDNRMGESIILGNIINHHVILNGADPSIYKNYSSNRNNKKIILYVTPRFDDDIKGSKYINEIAKLFKKNVDVEIHLVGTVPENYNFEPNIVKIGPLYNIDLAKEYSKADVLIMLSKAECFPMVCVESALCGTKIVAFKCGGPDKAFDSRFATFVDWGDFNSMKEEITKVLQNNYDKKELSNIAKTIYSKETMSHKYINLYTSISKR